MLNISLLLLHLCLILFTIESLLQEILQSLFFENFYYHSNFVESQLNHVGKTCLDTKRKLPCSSRTILSKSVKSHQVANLMNRYMNFRLLFKAGSTTKIETTKQVDVNQIFVHLLVDEILLNVFLFPFSLLISLHPSLLISFHQFYSLSN